MWFYTALFASLISGLSVAISKQALKNVSPIILYWIIITISTPLVAILAFKDGIPELNKYFFIGVGGSVLLYSFSRILQFRVIRDANLSQVYPLIALTPIFTLIAAYFPPLSERPSSIAIFGGLISLIGCYVLNISSLKEGIFEPFKILFKNKLALYMLIAVATLGLVTVLDKIAITGTDPKNTNFALFSENIIIILGFLPFLFSSSKREASFKEILNNKKLLLILGVLAAASNILGFISFGSANVGIVSAIFRSQIFFALFFGFFLLKDRPKFETIFGTIIMIAGLLIIKIS